MSFTRYCPILMFTFQYRRHCLFTFSQLFLPAPTTISSLRSTYFPTAVESIKDRSEQKNIFQSKSDKKTIVESCFCASKLSVALKLNAGKTRFNLILISFWNETLVIAAHNTKADLFSLFAVKEQRLRFIFVGFSVKSLRY